MCYHNFVQTGQNQKGVTTPYPPGECKMYKACKTERSAARQRLIERELLEMMKRVAYDDITITELCDEAKIPRKAFYRYFDSKDAALHGLIEHTLSEFHSRKFDEPNARSLHRELEDFFVFWYEHRELLAVLDRNHLLGMITQASTNFPIGNIVSLQRLLPDEENDAMRVTIFKFAIGGLVSIMFEWYNDGFRSSVPDIARRAVRILSKPPFPHLDKLGIVDLPI